MKRCSGKQASGPALLLGAGLYPAMSHTAAHLFWIAVCCHSMWQMDFSWLMAQTSLPHVPACVGPSRGWDGDARRVLRVPCLRWFCHFLNSVTLARPVQVNVTPGKMHRVTSLKPLLWIVNFDPPLVLNTGRWLIKNIMVMGYVLDVLGNVLLFQALKQGSEGVAGQKKAFFKPVLPPSKMLADPQSQSVAVCSGVV